ncbi:Hypothetical predicted protein [Pelobates cultripes]|uniref:Uncharacterized protein n=1 Tax=Pelobates cultripes TaxID=61616 RepID=A0AAD1S723_PELCU|nr:Hypothetical predicted protein [Pelobates cultripes]
MQSVYLRQASPTSFFNAVTSGVLTNTSCCMLVPFKGSICEDLVNDANIMLATCTHILATHKST